MMLILSASQPTVSATIPLRSGGTAIRRIASAIVTRMAVGVVRGPATGSLTGAHYPEHLGVDALDEIVTALVQLVDLPLGRGNLMVVVDTRAILFVPELDVGTRELTYQRSDSLVHHHSRKAA
jgi:hypothetical protein